MTTSPRHRLVVPVSSPRVQPPPDEAADDGEPGCGWYASSFALRQGLSVSELPDSDGSVAALWFATLDSTCLQ